MRPTGKTSLHFLMGCMDFCWLFAWARFTTSALIPAPFPLPESVLPFALGGLLARSLKGRGWPVITIIGLHMVLLTAASGLMLRAALAPHCPLWDVLAWLRALAELAPPFGSVRIALVSFWGVFLWVEGARLVGRPTTAETVWTRFDLGLGAFFALLLVQSFISLQLGGEHNTGYARYLMLSFLAFGLLGLGLSRSRTLTQKRYRVGFHAMGVLLTSSAIALLFGTALFSLFFPYLTAAARMGYGEMKTAAGHAEPYLIAILRFMFAPRGGSPVGKSTAAGGMGLETSAPLEQSGWVERMVTVAGWGLLGLLALAALVVAGLALWYFVLWLFSRTAQEPDDEPAAEKVSWWSILQRFLRMLHLRRRVASWGPIQLFSFLVVWGNRSGLSHRPQETPCEYGARLTARFPRSERDFESIVELFNRCVYGEMDPPPVQLRDGQVARRRLSNPLRWASRLRSRLSGAR